MSKRKVLLGIVAGLLVVSAVVGGVALAQAPANPSPTPPVMGYGRGMMGGMFGIGNALGDTTFLGTVAKALNIQVTDVVAQLDQGKTLRQVITDNKGDPNAIVDTFVASRKVVLDQLVKDGRLTQDQETQLLNTMKTQVTAQLDLTGTAMAGAQGRGFTKGYGVMGGGNGLVNIVATALKIPASQVMTEWSQGKTLRQVITAHQGDPNAIVDQYLANRKAALDQAVTNGQLTQDQENLILQNDKTLVNAQLDLVGTTVPAVPGMRGGFGGMMGGRGGMGFGRHFGPGRMFQAPAPAFPAPAQPTPGA